MSFTADFPILNQAINGYRLAYLDNAASMQEPSVVIDAVADYYRLDHSNVHRGVHALSQRATEKFDQARSTVARHLNARENFEVIFTKGCTESINLVAESWGRANLRPGDRILLTEMEHHANIVPWQIIRDATGAEIVVCRVTDVGTLDLDAFDQLLDERVKIVAVTHISNVLGTVNPVKEIITRSHAVGAKVLVDGAQAMGHSSVDVQDLDVDFYTVSGHKVYGPTGIGLLYGRHELLQAMPPYQTGGGMIRSVTFERTTFAPLPDKFEPGTPHIAGAIGLAAAVDYLAPKLTEAAAIEHELTSLAESMLRDIPGIRLIGTAPGKSGIVSFVHEDIHPHDIGTILDSVGVAVRTGHHCCQPLMRRMKVPGTVRASFAIYNTVEDVNALVAGLQKVIEVFKL